MHITVKGKLTEDLGGISAFKHTFDINWSADMVNQKDIFSVPIGPAKVQGSIGFNPEAINPEFEDIDLHIQLIFLGFPVYNVDETLAKHIANGLSSINVSHGQISFVGSLEVTP